MITLDPANLTFVSFIYSEIYILVIYLNLRVQCLYIYTRVVK